MPGGIGGAQIGYNYQIGPMVLGFEVILQSTMATEIVGDHCDRGWNDVGHRSNPLDRNITGKGRLRFPPLLGFTERRAARPASLSPR